MRFWIFLGLVLAIAPAAQADNIFGRLFARKPAAQSITLYTARHYDADAELYKAFEKQTGITVTVVQAKPELLVERLKAEGATSPADVILVADIASLERVKAAKLFQPLNMPAINARIPAALRDPDGQWTALAYRARVIFAAKNNASAKTATNYADLADPRFKGQVCVRPGDNPYNVSLVAGLQARWGEAKTKTWLHGLVANFARKPQGGDIDQIRAVASGQCSLAVANTYYYLRLLRSANAAEKADALKVAMVFPDQSGGGTHINVTGGGIAAHAPHAQAARAFLTFLTTNGAQAIFARTNNEYPANAGTVLPAELKPYAKFKIDPTPLAKVARATPDAQKLIDEAGWR